MMNFEIVSWIKLLPFLIVFGCGSAESVSNGDALGNADISEGLNEEETVSSNEPAYDWRDLRDFLADYAAALCDGIKDCCPDTTSYQQCMAGPNYMSRSMFPKDYVDLDLLIFNQELVTECLEEVKEILATTSCEEQLYLQKVGLSSQNSQTIFLGDACKNVLYGYQGEGETCQANELEVPGISANATVSTVYVCEPEMACDERVCTTESKVVGDSCDWRSSNCSRNSYCDIIEGVCVENRENGESCISDDTCKSGSCWDLVCSPIQCEHYTL